MSAWPEFITEVRLRQYHRTGFQWVRVSKDEKYILSRHRLVDSAWKAATGDAVPKIYAIAKLLERFA